MSELNEMGCQEFSDVAAELALGVLTGRERAQALAHLDHCASCREEVGQLTATGEVNVHSSGTARAKIEARDIVIDGAVDGSVVARDRVSIGESATLSGERLEEAPPSSKCFLAPVIAATSAAKSPAYLSTPSPRAAGGGC